MLMVKTAHARRAGYKKPAGLIPRILLVLHVLLLPMLMQGSAQAQNGYPVYNDTRVNDFANLLSPPEVAELRELFGRLKEQQGIEAVVVTIQAMGDYPVGAQTIESFATGLFNTWGVGDRMKNNGVMILVAVKDRKVRIELGSGYDQSLEQTMADVIQTRIIPCFKQNDYPGGILNGAKAVAEALGLPTPTPQTPARATARQSGNRQGARAEPDP